MRVAVDFKVVSTEAAMRGMGRYTQQQIREVLANDSEIELFLLMHGAVPEGNSLFDWDAYPNVHRIPVSVDGYDLDYRHSPSFDTVLAYSHRLQQLLKQLRIDVFHNTVPFMHPYYSAITVCPVVTTFYDAIPLIFPADYFAPPYGSPVLRMHYLRSMDNVANSDRVIAISQSAANDLRAYTGYPADRTHIAYPLIENIFRPRKDDAAPGGAANPASVVFSRLPEKVILSVTGIHRAKNVAVLVEAFEAAASEISPEWGLVIVLPSQFAREEFHRRFGSPRRVTALADISEDELSLLYNRAEIVVQPSMYEGFGYPVAEAMSCGAAVIATNASSIPEITGDAAILVSPKETRMMAASIVRLARDCALRAELKRRALERAPLFHDPRVLGQVTLDAYRRAAGVCGTVGAAPEAVRAKVRPRIAVWSSMPPKDCGVADYTYELVSQLATTHDVDVYVDGKYEPTPVKSRHVKFRHPDDYGIDGMPEQTIFQVGARKDYQDYMYPYIRKHGGTMVLHDISMAQAFYYMAKWSDSLNVFEDEVVRPEGLDVLDEYTRLEANATMPPHEALQPFFTQHKMLRWLIDRSDRMIVHTDPLRKRLLADYPDARAENVRMGVVDRIPEQRHVPLAVLRRAFGIKAGDVCVGSFGIMDRVKRLDVVIRSFTKLCESHPTSLLILVGSCYDAAYKRELKALIRGLGVAERVLFLDYVPQEAFQIFMTLADVVVNLRSPDRLGLSAVLLRALAAAKPVVLSDIAEWRIFPDDTCLWVAAGEREVGQLSGHLVELAGNQALRDRYGRAARRWFLKNGTLESMARDYLRPLAGSRERRSRHEAYTSRHGN